MVWPTHKKTSVSEQLRKNYSRFQFLRNKTDADFAATTSYNFISLGYTIKIHRSTSYPRLDSRPFTRSKSVSLVDRTLILVKKKGGNDTKDDMSDMWIMWPQISHIQKRSRDKVCCQCPDFSSALIASNFIETTNLPILESPKEFQLPGFSLGNYPPTRKQKMGEVVHITSQGNFGAGDNLSVDICWGPTAHDQTMEYLDLRELLFFEGVLGHTKNQVNVGVDVTTCKKKP